MYPADLSEGEQPYSRVVVVNLKNQLACLLEDRGMTAAELSRKAKVPKQALSRWLSGQVVKNVSQLKRVADVFGVNVDHLLFGEGPQEVSSSVSDIGALLGDAWVGGVFELKLRRVKPSGGGSKL